MQLGPGRPPQAAFVLGAAGAFGALLWTVMLHLLAKGGVPATDRLVLLLLPAALASIALGFGCGFWVGRRRRIEKDMTIAAAAQTQAAKIEADLHRAAERAEAETRRIALLLDSAAPGAALFDATHRLLAWSRGFAALVEVPDAALHPGLILADLVRLQPASPTRKMSRHGIESGVAGAARRQRGDGSHVEDRWSPGAEGGMLLTCRPAEAPRQAMPLSASALAALCAEEVRTRLPRLQAAIVAGDAAAARMEAHAIRGVAGSFGLDALAEALLTLETAARAGDLTALAAASAGLPQLAEADLRHLARQPA
jgi:PAS domain-containing protein/HPt (histidine-containing phosphotransfer) domain-containing protein